jgi:YD repeat-containing protein
MQALTPFPNGLVYSADERGLTTTNTYDALNRLTCTVYPDGTYLSNIYTKLDLSASRDRLGNWTYFGYDALRRQTALTNALGQVTLTTYCGCGSPATISNALGVTTYIYDNAGRLTQKIDRTQPPGKTRVLGPAGRCTGTVPSGRRTKAASSVMLVPFASLSVHSRLIQGPSDLSYRLFAPIHSPSCPFFVTARLTPVTWKGSVPEFGIYLHGPLADPLP